MTAEWTESYVSPNKARGLHPDVLGGQTDDDWMGVQSPHPLEVDRHNDTPEPTGRTYLGSGRKEGAKQRMGDSGPQILTPCAQCAHMQHSYHVRQLVTLACSAPVGHPSGPPARLPSPNTHT